jgi:hypothetical protein
LLFSIWCFVGGTFVHQWILVLFSEILTCVLHCYLRFGIESRDILLSMVQSLPCYLSVYLV